MTQFGLTRRQKRILDFVRQYRDAHGISPSYQEIADGCGIKSKSNVFDVIQALKKRGHVMTLYGSRSIVVL